MNRRILIQVATPAVFVGLLLCGTCLVSAWYVNRLQANLANILAQNVSSMQAAQQLEIVARKLRFHCYLYLIDPHSSFLAEIRTDQRVFDEWLGVAERWALTPGEKAEVVAIRHGHQRYQTEFEQARALVGRAGGRDFRKLAEIPSIRHVTDPCRANLRTNEEMMNRAVQDSALFTQRLHLTMLLLALVGPMGGLLAGYGIARGLSRSLHRLSVRVQGAAQQLDPPGRNLRALPTQEVATLHLSASGDLQQLDRQIQHVVERVGEVTGRLQRQQAEVLRAQQLAAVGQLAASVAHEVRNPLTSIKMLVEAALRDNRPRPFTPDNLRVVHGEVLRLEHTVQEFLDFARPPALERRHCDLLTVVQQATDLVRARARQQKVQVEMVTGGGPFLTEIDPGQVCTVLVNLFVNALDAMPRGGALTAELRPSPDAITLTVSDTGEGISPVIVPKLFTPFASGKPTGSGLGLSVSRRIIEEHGGTIEGGNRPGGGASFIIALPLHSEGGASHADAAGH